MNCKSILVFGTGKGCDFFIALLKNTSNISAFIDSDRTKIGTKFYGIDVISPQQICNYKYDYIIIVSQFYFEIKSLLLNLDIETEKIIEFYRILPIKIEEKFNLQKSICDFVSKDYKILVTGISYALRGINEKKFNQSTINLAMSSQDLFYDYNIVQRLFKIKPKNKIRKAILGISYYSFHYDLSKSSVKDRCLIYYNTLKKVHNLVDTDLLNQYINYNKLEELIFKENYLNIACEQNNNFNTLTNKLLHGKLDDTKYDTGVKIAKLHSKKNYPKTYKENLFILTEFIKFLNYNGIEIALVIFPTSSYYYNYFSKQLINEFYNTINELREEYKFQFYDFFDSKLFNDNDFYDVNHLNEIGANKFTKILNDHLSI